MAKNKNNHITAYRTYFNVLMLLIVLTAISVAVTGVNLGRLAVFTALLLASVKSALVLWYFMHLKYENRALLIMVGLVLFLFVAVMIVTFIDYSFQ